MIYEKCPVVIHASIPNTQIESDFPCMLILGHQGHHRAQGTLNGLGFEVEYENIPSTS